MQNNYCKEIKKLFIKMIEDIKILIY